MKKVKKAKKKGKRLGLPDREDEAIHKAAARAYETCENRFPMKTMKSENWDCEKGVNLVLDRIEPLDKLTTRDLEIAIEFSVLHCGLQSSKKACRDGIRELISQMGYEDI